LGGEKWQRGGQDTKIRTKTTGEQKGQRTTYRKLRKKKKVLVQKKHKKKKDTPGGQGGSFQQRKGGRACGAKEGEGKVINRKKGGKTKIINLTRKEGFGQKNVSKKKVERAPVHVVEHGGQQPGGLVFWVKKGKVQGKVG